MPRPTREEHERGLALFLERQHKSRFLASLYDAKLRAKLRGKLNHFKWLDARYVQAVPTTKPDELARMLRDKGAGQTCVLVAGDMQLDRLELSLEDGLREVLHSDWGALVSCVPGRLALFSDEAPNKTTTILRRDADGLDHT